MKAKYSGKCLCGNPIRAGDEIVNVDGYWVIPDCERCKRNEEAQALVDRVHTIMEEVHGLRWYGQPPRDFFSKAKELQVIDEQEYNRIAASYNSTRLWENDWWD